MIAIISDVHGNLEALDAVLADIDRRGAERVWCLGDLVGYGPDPAACVARVLDRCERVLMGNHDHAMLFGSVGFNEAARASLDYARRCLEPSWRSLPGTRRRWRALRALPLEIREEGIACYHASPRDPLNEYLLRTDCQTNRDKLREALRKIDGLCVVGHTHVAGVITERFEFLAPDELIGGYLVGPQAKAIVNAGSVGQPRDGDPRASYCTVDADHRVRIVRVDYDRDATTKKIRRTKSLAPQLAERLERGV